MEVQSNENAALLKLLKTRSRTKTELLKVSGARRGARQAALDALLAEGKVIRIDGKYFANDPIGSVDQLIDAEAARLDAYLRSVPELLSRSGKKLRRAMKDNALALVALQRLLETGQVIEFKYKKQRLCLHSAHLPQQSAQVRHSQETSPDLDHDLSLQEVHQAYDRVRGRQLGSAVFISDLASELQIGFLKLHEWIHREVIKIRSRQPGRGPLADGDRGPTGRSDRTSRFQAASYSLLTDDFHRWELIIITSGRPGLSTI